MKIKYQFVYGTDPTALSNEVNRWVAEGYTVYTCFAVGRALWVVLSRAE